MGPLAAAAHLLRSEFKPSISLSNPKSSLFLYRRVPNKRNNQPLVPVARLFGPAIFPWIYTLTQSDVTSKLTLAIYRSINNYQEKRLPEENTKLMDKSGMQQICLPISNGGEDDVDEEEEDYESRTHTTEVETE